MKRILLVSDSHGNDNAVYDVYANYVGHVDYLIHCGDVCSYDTKIEADFLCVRGNNDFNEAPLDRILTIEQRKILVTHGTRFTDYDKQLRLVEKAKQLVCDTVFYGHTHIPNIDVIAGITLINPGSLNYNRNGTGQSFALVTIDGNHIDAHIEYLQQSKKKRWLFE